MNDYDVAQSQASTLKTALVATLNAARQYVIPADPVSVKEFRSALANAAADLERDSGAASGKSGDGFGARINNAFRAYHDLAARYVEELRERLTSTTNALREMLTSFQSDDSDAEQRLKTEIVRLKALDELKTLDEVRACVRTSVSSLASCVDQLRREKDVVIAQLRDEIRTLQNTIEQTHRSAAKDSVTGAYPRREYEKMIQRAIVRGQPVTVIRLWLQNLRTLTAQNPVNQILAAFSKRAQEAVPEEAVCRWQDDVFCVLVPSGGSQAAAAALAKKCAGIYAYMDGKNPRTLHLQVAIASFPYSKDADVDKFLASIDAPKR